MVVGWSATASGVPHAFRWQNGVMTDLGTLGGMHSSAEAINSDGVIVGWSDTPRARRAARWLNGNLRSLGTLGGQNSQATDISPLGVIVGWSQTASGETHAFLWKNGVMKDLGTLGGRHSSAVAINRGEVVVGGSTTADGTERNHAFRYRNGVMEDLDRGRWGRLSSWAMGINNAGVIVGLLGAFPDAQGEELDFTSPFRWHQGVMTVLNAPGEAMDVNPDGVIAGSYLVDGGTGGDAWVWQNGITTFLPEPINSSAVSAANAINPRGDVVGYVQPNCSFDEGCTGPQHATLWKRN